MMKLTCEHDYYLSTEIINFISLMLEIVLGLGELTLELLTRLLAAVHLRLQLLPVPVAGPQLPLRGQQVIKQCSQLLQRVPQHSQLKPNHSTTKTKAN